MRVPIGYISDNYRIPTGYLWGYYGIPIGFLWGYVRECLWGTYRKLIVSMGYLQ
jgi:hypothetical protein